jgi:hypothetical protein
MLTRRLHLFVLIALACLIPVLGQEPKPADQTDQTPTLSAAEMKRQTVSCKPHKISRGLLPKGTVVPIQVSVDEKGEVGGLTPVGRCPVGCGLLAEPITSIRNCKFAPLMVNGRAVPYKGDVELVAP